jgi:chitodextrinase
MKTITIKKSSLFILCFSIWFASLGLTSGVASGNGDTQVPTVPTSLQATEITRTSFKLHWTASSDNVGVKEYRVFRNEKLISTSATNSFIVSLLTLNTTYKMRVVAVDLTGNVSKSSATISVKTLADTVPPQPPTGLQASNVGLSSLQLNWQAASDDVGVTRYEIYLDGILKVANRISKSTISTSATLGGLSADSKYTVTVKAFDAMNNGSEHSQPLEVEMLADTVAPLRVSGLAADSVTSTSFRLLWDRSTDNLRISEYEVFRNGVSLGKTNSNSWSISNLQSSTAHSMTVVAYDESGNKSIVSPSLSVTTNASNVNPSHKLTLVSVSKPVSKGATSITYQLAEASNITVSVHNTSSHLLLTPLSNVAAKAGTNRVNLSLAALGSGDFVVRISAKKADNTETQLLKMVTVDLTAPVIQISDANVESFATPAPIDTSVFYTLSEPANVSFRILNSANKLVHSLSLKPTSFPGDHAFTWDGKNAKGVAQASGHYTVQIDAKDLLGTSAVRKMASIVLRPKGVSLFNVFAGKNGVDAAATGSFSKQNQVAYNPARWAFTSGQINWANYPTVTPFTESSVFGTELTHRANSSQADRSWSIRIGKGGNIYSIKLPVVGEISPPSFRQPGWNQLSPWNDDGMTTTLNSSFISNNDTVMGVFGNGYIHGSGMYISPSADAQNNKPFHSPQLAGFYDAEERSYATINWGVVPKPSVNRGDIMIYSKYRDAGNGIIELNYYYYNFGAISYDFAEAPWWMVRRSLFPHQIRGTTGANFEIFDRTYGTNHTFNVNSFAGWGASTQDAGNPNAMTAAMVWGKDKDWSAQSALKNSGGDYWQTRTSAAAYGKVNDLARDGQLLTSVIFPLIKPGEGFHFRRYLVFGKLSEVAQTAATLVDQVDYKRIEFDAATSGKMALYETTRSGQKVLTATPPSYSAIPIGYSSPVPLKGSQPLMLMKNVESGQYFLSTDPYAASGKKPFVNPYATGDAKYDTYQNRVIYQPYDGKTEWISLLGYVLPKPDSGLPANHTTLSEATDVIFLKGEKRDANELMLFEM